MQLRRSSSDMRPAHGAGRIVAFALASLMFVDVVTARADWWRPRGGSGGGGGGGSVSGPSSSGSGSGGGRNGSSSGTPRPTTPPRGSYSPGSCSWVTISRQAQYVDPSGRTVYEITQKNTCTGEVRTLFGY